MNKTTLILIFILFGFLFCFGCSKSGRRKVLQQSVNSNLASNLVSNNLEKPIKNKTVIKMKKKNGVYEIPTEINGVSMYFIFDTGASLISISEKEINLLSDQGKFSTDDVVGEGNFIDANGDISEGTIVKLKTVKIGDRVLNDVEASVVHNLKAPLLMGQSALEKFGKISIDYKNLEIIFE